MSDVKRFMPVGHMADSNGILLNKTGQEFVLASEYDALLARCREQDAKIGKMLGYHVEDEARIAQLEQALIEAIDMVEWWGAYASDYFKDKHNLAGDIAELRAALAPGAKGKE